MIICKPILNIGPEAGTTQTASVRLCKPIIGVGPEKGETAQTGLISYGTSGTISYGTSGEITY